MSRATGVIRRRRPGSRHEHHYLLAAFGPSCCTQTWSYFAGPGGGGTFIGT